VIKEFSVIKEFGRPLPVGGSAGRRNGAAEPAEVHDHEGGRADLGLAIGLESVLRRVPMRPQGANRDLRERGAGTGPP